MSGKGSSRRPQQVPDENVQDAWKRIFGRKPIKTQEQLNEWLNVAIAGKEELPQVKENEQPQTNETSRSG